ncbi:MAG: hypothetical protein K0Q60_3117, partial [Microvirga sp.]|nr:hypothetical protein [Microvirga sp.]
LTVTTLLIDRAPPSVGLPTAVYSPKHRSGRYLNSDCLQSPARTPPPTLLFPSQQCQRAKFHPRRDRKRTSQTPEHLTALRKPEAPRHQFVRTAPPMKMFYPNPFFRSTSISNFFRNHCHPAPLLSIQTSFSIRKVRICLCVYLIQINDIDPTSFCFPSEEPLVIARY